MSFMSGSLSRAASLVVLAATAGACSLLTDLGGLSSGGPADAAAPTDGAATGPDAETPPETLPDGTLVFRDTTSADFAAGTHTGTRGAADALALAGATKGTFRSRVFDAGRGVTLATLRWVPAGPYGKPLPDGQKAESGYARDGLDMRNNVLLFHFDGATGAAPPVEPDRSGSDTDGTTAGDAELATGGVIGGALRDLGSGWVRVRTSSTSPLQLRRSDVTWSYWVRSTQPCPADNPPSGNRVHMGIDENTSNATHVWLGCSSSLGPCDASNRVGRAGGTWCSQRGADSDCASFCGATRIDDGAFHHVAVVKRGHDPGSIQLFVDGRPDASPTPIRFKSEVSFEDGIDFGVGALSGPSFQAAGDFDEVAVWRRALSDAEIGAVYRRGALGAELRVRACERPDCADEPPFVGVTDSAPFTDPPGALAPPTPRPPARALRGRYLQYQVSLRSMRATDSPELLEVTLTATP